MRRCFTLADNFTHIRTQYSYNFNIQIPIFNDTSLVNTCIKNSNPDSSGGRFLVNELQPPFSRVHACLRNVANPRENCRIEDSGYQGTYNLLRFGGQQQLEYDRVFNPLAAASYNKHERSLAEVERPRVEARARNSLRETSFDRVMIHSSCVPQPERFRA